MDIDTVKIQNIFITTGFSSVVPVYPYLWIYIHILSTSTPP